MHAGKITSLKYDHVRIGKPKQCLPITNLRSIHTANGFGILSVAWNLIKAVRDPKNIRRVAKQLHVKPPHTLR